MRYRRSRLSKRLTHIRRREHARTRRCVERIATAMAVENLDGRRTTAAAATIGVLVRRELVCRAGNIAFGPGPTCRDREGRTAHGKCVAAWGGRTLETLVPWFARF